MPSWFSPSDTSLSASEIAAFEMNNAGGFSFKLIALSERFTALTHTHRHTHTHLPLLHARTHEAIDSGFIRLPQTPHGV